MRPLASRVGVGDAAGINAAPGSELTETTRLADRRSLVVGDRAYAMSTADTLYPAAGWHIRGEMGGVWTPPIKLVDGVWFRLADKWLGDPDGARPPGRQRAGATPAPTSPTSTGSRVQRTDFVPDGTRATLVGLALTSPQPRTVPVAMDAHSELMSSYPWGWTTPNAGTFNLPDTGVVRRWRLRVPGHRHPTGRQRDRARLGRPRRSRHRTPSSHELGPDHRGPQDPAVVCPADGPAPTTCDDGAFGKGTGGQLRWQVRLTPNQPHDPLVRASRGSDRASTPHARS